MRSIRVYYNTGDSVDTNINGTDSEILAYYLNKKFNIGEGGNDKMAIAICVNFLDKPLPEQHKDALRTILSNMTINDNSIDRQHPWIPGTDCKAIKNMLLDLKLFE